MYIYAPGYWVTANAPMSLGLGTQEGPAGPAGAAQSGIFRGNPRAGLKSSDLTDALSDAFYQTF